MSGPKPRGTAAKSKPEAVAIEPDPHLEALDIDVHEQCGHARPPAVADLDPDEVSRQGGVRVASFADTVRGAYDASVSIETRWKAGVVPIASAQGELA